MNANNQDCVSELQQRVHDLGSALATSERRTARLERGLRWAGIGAIAALSISLGAGLRPLGDAIAQATMLEPSKSVEEALDRINQNLMPIGQMGHMMQAGFEAAVVEAQAAVNDPNSTSPLRPFMLDWLQAHNIAPDQATEAHYRQAIMEAAGGVMTDAGVLMARLRKDSDKIHALISALFEQVQEPEKGLQAISNQLITLNEALESVPDMSVMTQQMGTMSYSVGSTMGRAGSWMPW